MPELLWFDKTMQVCNAVGWERHGRPPRHFYLPLTKRISDLVISVWAKLSC